MSYTRNSRNVSTKAAATTPFCKVCYDAGLPTEQFTSHFVKDQPGPNGKVVCPTLLAQRCLICGIPGHTSSYCPDNSSISSSSTVQNTRFTPAMATDEVRYPPHSIRLPPIQFQNRDRDHRDREQNTRPVPRIVYPDTPSYVKPKNEKNDFPSLPNLSSLRRFENDEPMLKREHEFQTCSPAAAASPVHSPLTPQSPKKWTKVKYNKNNNPFGDLDNNSDIESDNELPPLIVPTVVVTKNTEKQQASSSWASIAAGNKVATTTTNQQQSTQHQQQRTRSRFSIVIPTEISAGPLLPPIAFKPKPMTSSEAEKKKQVKKMWGDTDSEDDEEFLSRGLVNCGYFYTLPEP